VMLLTSAVIAFVLMVEDADKILDEAQAAMEQNSYPTAIVNYEHLLEKASNHPERSKARMELAMTRIRQRLAMGPQQALEEAKKELEATANEADFREAEAHLSDLLPQIAEELAVRAEKTNDQAESQKFHAMAKDALGMAYNTKYIPKARRDATQLEGIRETIDRVERRQQALVDLETTLTNIAAAVDKGEAGKAFNEQEQLVDKHPSLLGNPRLAEALAKIAAAEQASITYNQEVIEATTDDRPTPVEEAMGMVTARHEGDAPTQGMYFVQVSGVAYGTNAKNGEVAWRRYVGPMTEPIYPQPLGDDAVLLEWTGAEGEQKHELVRIAGDTGELKWRLPLDDICAEPLVHGDKIYLSGMSGKLHVVDAESGRREGYVAFAQPLKSPPAVHTEKQVMYVAGEHSSLYSIRLADNSCIGVTYSSHARNAIAAAPVVVLDKVAVVENDGAQTCKVRMFALNADGALDKPLQERRLEGRVLRSPLVSGRRMVVMTDRGQIAVYEVSAGAEGEPLSEPATRPAMSGSPHMRFGAISDGFIWYGENALSKFVVAPTGDRLTIQDLAEDYNRSQFVAPLEIREGVVLHVRSRRGHAGFTVTACSADNGKPYWEMDIAAPPAGEPVSAFDGKAVLGADANGQAYRFQPSGEGTRFVKLASREQNGTPPSGEPQTYRHSTPLPGGYVIYSSPGTEEVLWQNGVQGESRLIQLPSALACQPVAFGEGWLAPLELGQVFYLDAQEGKPLAAPFQPPLAAGTTVHWLPPAVIDEEQFVVTDGLKKIYLVELRTEDVPALEATREEEIGESPLVTPLTIAGGMVIAGTQDGSCALFRATNLEPQPSIDLGSAVVWGPYGIGDVAIARTADDRLVALDKGGQVTWERAFSEGRILGPPVLSSGACLLAIDSGSILTVSLADGTDVSQVMLYEPLAGGLAAVAGGWVVTGRDGTLLRVKVVAEAGGKL
jgi:outer membrane protein assembly factor BamB/tetratricopeptide (TPR) repeat protein